MVSGLSFLLLSSSTVGFMMFLVILGILALYFLPKLQVSRSRANTEAKGPLELENDYRQTLVQVFGGLAIIATVYAAFDNARLAQESADLTRQSIELTRQGQIADRTFKALELLAQEKNVDAKLAAIYALEQVTDEDPKSEWQITETLYNYVLIHSKWTPRSGSKPPGGGEADIRAVGNYLSRRQYKIEKGECLEQHQCWDYEKNGMPPAEKRPLWDKRIINLPHADLREIFLDGAMLNTANINGSHMERAWLRRAHFENAYGDNNTYLTNADMSDSHWAFANLKGAHLDGAQLCRAHLEHVYAEDLDLTGADLENSNWSNIPPFRQTVLKDAHLNCSNWHGADMQDLDLEGATLFGADLRGARNLSKQQLEKAQGDNSTQLDSESLRPANWSRNEQAKCPKTPSSPQCP